MKRYLFIFLFSLSALNADIITDTITSTVGDSIKKWYDNSASSFSSSSLTGMINSNLGGGLADDAWQAINMCYSYDQGMNFNLNYCDVCNNLETTPLCPPLDLGNLGLTTSPKKQGTAEKYTDALKNYCKVYCNKAQEYGNNVINTIEDVTTIRKPNDVYRLGKDREELLKKVENSTALTEENKEFFKAVAGDKSGAVLREYIEAALFATSQGKTLTPKQFMQQQITPPFENREQMEKLIQEESDAKAVALQQSSVDNHSSQINAEYAAIEEAMLAPSQKIIKKQNLSQQLFAQYASKLDEDFEIIEAQTIGELKTPHMDSYLNDKLFTAVYETPAAQAQAKQALLQEVKEVAKIKAALNEEKERKKALYKLWLQSKEIASSRFDPLLAQQRIDECIQTGACY